MGETANSVGDGAPSGPRGSRSGGVAVRHGDPAPGLRHLDDLHRVVGNGHELELAHPARHPFQGAGAQRQDGGVVDRCLGGEGVEHLPHLARPGRCAVDPGRDLGDLLLDRLQVALGAGQQDVRGDLGVEPVPEPGREALLTQPGIAVTHGELGFEPALVLVQRSQGRVARLPDGHLERRLTGEQRVQFGPEQRRGALGLDDGRLHVDARLLTQHAAGQLQRARDGGHPGRQRDQPGGRVARLTHEQRVEGVARQVQQGVALVLAQLLERPEVARDAGAQDLQVDPVGDVECGVVDVVQRAQRVPEHRDPGRHALRGEVVEAIVEAVVAEFRRRLRGRLQQPVEDPLGDDAEPARGGSVGEALPGPLVLAGGTPRRLRLVHDHHPRAPPRASAGRRLTRGPGAQFAMVLSSRRCSAPGDAQLPVMLSSR